MHWKNNMSILGYNYRLTDFQSSLGISQLKKVNFLLKKRARIASVYNRNFSQIENITIPYTKKKKYSCLPFISITNRFQKN